MFVEFAWGELEAGEDFFKGFVLAFGLCFHFFDACGDFGRGGLELALDEELVDEFGVDQLCQNFFFCLIALVGCKAVEGPVEGQLRNGNAIHFGNHSGGGWRHSGGGLNCRRGGWWLGECSTSDRPRQTQNQPFLREHIC